MPPRQQRRRARSSTAKAHLLLLLALDTIVDPIARRLALLLRIVDEDDRPLSGAERIDPFAVIVVLEDDGRWVLGRILWRRWHADAARTRPRHERRHQVRVVEGT